MPKNALKILQARLQQHVNRELPDVQTGFRKGRGTRDQIANIRWIMEKAREFQKNICFIDYAKAFDCVDHNKLWKMLQETGIADQLTCPFDCVDHNQLWKMLQATGIADQLTCLLRNLYTGQEVTVRNRHGTIGWFQIGKGVSFNLYAECIM